MQPLLDQPEMLCLRNKSPPSPGFSSLEFASPDETLLPKQSDNAALLTPIDGPLADGTPYQTSPPPPPEHSLISTIPTPIREALPNLSTPAIGEEHYQIASNVLLPLAATKGPMNLRLPSFQLLGIAAPHSESIPISLEGTSVPAGVELVSETCRPLRAMQTCGISTDQDFTNFTPKLVNTPAALRPDHLTSTHKVVRQYILTQTPPDDDGAMNWGSVPANIAAGGKSDDQDGLGLHFPASGSSEESTSPAKGQPSMSLIPQESSFSADSGPLWINKALHLLLDNVSRNNSSEHIKVLSHALPSPSSEGHAFPAVIERLQQTTGPDSITWMNIFHAVSGKFSLADLPKSPPTTPAPPNEGEDYFTTRVFNMAVEVPDYSEKLAAQPMLQKLLCTPAIAPSSLDVSVVERYIPPTSTIEFEELFSSTGRSFLSDRLIELSTKHGTLLFIYPTKAGGMTFKKEYLAPVLDPILRELGTTHELSTDLLLAIGSMPAVDKLLSFEEMKAHLQEFCRSLSVDGSTPHGRYHAAGATYSLVHASPQRVPLSRTVWAQDWWAKQEKTKIQKAFENHDVHRAETVKHRPRADAKEQLATAKKETQDAAKAGVDHKTLLQRAKTQELIRAYERARGEKRPDDNEMLILKLLKEVVTRPYPRGPPLNGVEVGVFVVQKTLRKEGATNQYLQGE